MTPTLSTLLSVYPPVSFVLIGAGNGNSELIRFLLAHNMNNGALVEANAEQFQYLKERIAKSSVSQGISKSVHGNNNNTANNQLSHTLNKQTQGALNWHLIHDVVSVKTDNTYFVTNKTVEDGLIDPQYLSNIWPNIKLKHTENVQAIHLNTVYDALPTQPNWLLIDCLGAELIIDIENDLNTLDVICMRVLLNDSHQLPSNNQQFNALNTALYNAYFKNISITPSNHPQIAHAIFVRDYKKQNEFESTKAHSAYEKALSTAEEQSKSQQAQAEQTLANALAQQAQIEQTLQVDIAQKDANIAELKAQHEQAMSEAHSAYEKALSTAEEHSKAQQAQAEQTLANALAQQAQIEQTLQADIAQKDANIAELKAQHEQAMNEVHSAYEKALSTAEKYVLESKSSITKFEDKVNKQNAEITKLRAKVTELEASLSYQQSYKVILQDELNNLEKSINIFNLLEDQNES